ncbi:MAG: hypothetical protein DMF85_16475, partial [Acidobacteria bacterium]
MNQTSNPEPQTPNRLWTYLSFVRFSHSVFALPFALTGALLALHRNASWTTSYVASRVLWVVVAMVAARSAAMGFNRVVDARLDGLNPRTANRELPRGAMTGSEAIAFAHERLLVREQQRDGRDAGQVQRPEIRDDAERGETEHRHDVHRARDDQRAANAERDGDRPQALRPIELEVLTRVQDV